MGVAFESSWEVDMGVSGIEGSMCEHMGFGCRWMRSVDVLVGVGMAGRVGMACYC